MARKDKWEARRWSGEVRLYVRYDDEESTWIVSMNYQDYRQVVQISSSRWIEYETHSVDSPEGWDYACKSALSFSAHDDSEDASEFSNNCSYNDKDEVHIGRSFETAWFNHPASQS